jgi:hypothetical protein
MRNIHTTWFETLNESEIRRLYGGLIRGSKYFVAITDQNNNIVAVFYAHLKNNFQSQRSNSSYPAGYLPFLIFENSRNFVIHTNQFEIRTISIWKTFISRPIQRCNARILRTPPEGSEQFLLLQEMSNRALLQEQVTRLAIVNIETLGIAGDLLQEAVLGQKPISSIPLIADPANRFQFYLDRASSETLKDLVSLLQVGLVKGQVAGRAA